MGDDEAIEGSKMGTRLIMFSAIIGMAFLVFWLAKTLIYSGVNDMDAAAENVKNSIYDDYDNRPVRGLKVKRALEDFSGEEVIIMIHTLHESDIRLSGKDVSQALNQARTIGGGHVNESGGVSLSDGKPLQRLVSIPGISSDSSTDFAEDDNPKFVNYNAVAAITGNYSSKVQYNKANGSFIYNDDFVKEGSSTNIAYNLSTRYTTRKSSPEYIPDNALFNAYLIKNRSNEIVGMVFMQQHIG